MTQEERELIEAALRTYDEEVERGIQHTPGWQNKMQQYRLSLDGVTNGQ